MKILRQMALLLLMLFIGDILNRVFKIPVPGSILGMILLLLALITGIIKLHQIEEICKFLLDHLSFFFIPAGVGLLSVTGLLKDSWYLLLLVCIITAILVMSVTALIVQFLRRQ
ncbi:CidA/LrgA family protein [Clostridium sp. CS001]|uniref:CidA/LrgA family protein n=1 Tax=Clostridium sp. CS001 TaxID=2880648 RepID=UPI001CF37B87|nr:CidA/LrgA family protein [Clostridium sp. CS001]MCB2288566.1 CidA/LrgA family protein [Clostridium sp. CS001]